MATIKRKIERFERAVRMHERLDQYDPVRQVEIEHKYAKAKEVLRMAFAATAHLRHGNDPGN